MFSPLPSSVAGCVCLSWDKEASRGKNLVSFVLGRKGSGRQLVLGQEGRETFHSVQEHKSFTDSYQGTKIIWGIKAISSCLCDQWVLTLNFVLNLLYFLVWLCKWFSGHKLLSCKNISTLIEHERRTNLKRTRNINLNQENCLPWAVYLAEYFWLLKRF